MAYGGGDIGPAVAAGLYVGSNVFSWSEARQMPQRQADANKKVIQLENDFNNERITEMRDILRAAIGDWETDVDTILDDGTSFEEAFAEVPRAAEFVPVDPCCEQSSTIECNMDKVFRADEFYRSVNRLHEQNDLIHMLSFDPGFLVNLDIQNTSIQNDMRGICDVGDIVDVLTDNAEQACLTGRIGNSRKTTNRDIGITKRRVKVGGRAEFREAIQWINTVVSPMSRQGDIRGMMLDPSQRITLALQQAQLIQNSLQNKNNALAQKEPFLLAKLQTRLQNLITKLQYKASEALLDNRATPNFAAITPVKGGGDFSQLFNILGGAVEHADRSHFYGPPPQAQDGYTGQSSATGVSTKNAPRAIAVDESSIYGDK